MEMEVLIPINNMDFDFNSARSSPYPTAPSSPKRFGEYYLSAPSSPTRLSHFYHDFNDLFDLNNSRKGEHSSYSSVPFDWEEKPGTPKSDTKFEDDFVFDVDEKLEKASLSAEELFDGGVIRPLKPPPRLQLPADEYSPLMTRAPISPKPSSRSPISNGRRIIRDVFSPKHKKDFDPFAAAVENTCKTIPEQERGRERVPALSSSSSRRREVRSVSPLRVSKYPWEEEEEEEQQLQESSKQSSVNTKPPLTSTFSTLSSSSSKGHRKWRLKDFFLFRSASEGRAADKDPLRKYSSLFKKHEDVKNSSFRANENSGSGSRWRRKGPVSAHELHYTVNRAASEDLKKKTFLPYKQGILGRLAFNPAVHALANGFGFSHK